MSNKPAEKKKKKADPTNDNYMDWLKMGTSGNKGGSDKAYFDEKMSEILFWLDKIKNSQSIKTGKYEALTRLFTGQKMYVDTRDVSETPHLLLDGIREESVTKAFREIWQPHFVLFDVGANFGYFPLLAGTDIEKRGIQLHLFEANPDLIELLQKTLSVNGLTECSKIVNAAISDRPGQVTLNRLKGLWGGASINPEEKLKSYRPVEVNIDKIYDIRSITLDSYRSEENIGRVDLVKVDVEGVEDKVYDGMSETIKANPEIILMIEFTFDAYDDSRGFFKKISSDFKNLYGIDENGFLLKISDYKEATEIATSEWLMVVASNNPL